MDHLKKICTTGGKAACAAVLSLAVALPAMAIDKVRWKMPVAFKSSLPGLGSPSVFAAEQLEQASGGAMKVKVFEPNKLVPPFEILSVVSEGKVKAGYTWIGYDQGKIPSIPLFAAIPFGLKPWAYMSWYYEGGGHDMLQEVYANKGYKVHAELCGIIGPETAGWYKKPLESLDDYNGLKIRFAGIGGKVIQKLGASVTMMPGGELFQALEKGTIDATEFSLPQIDQLLGFNKIVKYNLFPGWHQPFTASYMLINKGEYDGLGDDTKALIRNVCTAATVKGLTTSEYNQGAIIAGFGEKGVTAQKLPRDILVKLKSLTEEVLAEESAKDADFKRVYESQQAFQNNYKLWEGFAYLPSDL
ncbi:TRAP transporter substrate-binding protein [Solemya velum gill symbiont]|uniref:TRAP transporter substrate-binding protein n=1 Tax=Solemya velum gill symbiont TaxID=2340 RepID=UPI000998C6C8|nr:C4-dicarboxylate ABC transporter [Solemya velum gill symbiont]OOZ47491.1 C4-dicarboxylate ABC transporter [Solemya velum gill symbiont]OOZ49959.1 C4-dicarboxylate ABC transporter [Solemya velum gill symbiont]OOZ51698.1 C4-dicarboxylate ABC transporter [Solemya velum gill symbiont]OOZ55506.1 C4-dicarboxylate ABC transporter [Solemya velum gill symbiont]